jgi:predicted Rossmann-fold nucleotide-binding protein
MDWIKGTLLESNGNISEKDLNLFRIVDTADEAVEHFVKFYQKYNLTPNF